MHTSVRISKLGQYVGLKNAFQNLLASWPVPATPSQVSPGVSMNVKMPLMMTSVNTDETAYTQPTVRCSFAGIQSHV